MREIISATVAGLRGPGLTGADRDYLDGRVTDVDAGADRALAAASLVATRVIALPPSDDGLIAIEVALVPGGYRFQRGQYLNGRGYDPSRIVDLPPTDDGVLPVAVARAGDGFRILSGRRLDADGDPLEMVFPTDARLTFSGFSSIAERSAQRFRGKRTMYDDGKGWQWHCPQGRLSFYTAASRVRLDVAFNGSVGGQVITSQAGRAPFRAPVLVNGAPVGEILGDIGQVQGAQARSFSFNLPAGTNRIDLIWPYDKAMDLTGIRISQGGGIAPASLRARLLVTSGDSITHSFNAASSITAWTYLVAEALGVGLINMGYGGRVCDPVDGTVAGAQQGDIGTYLIGFNDCADAVAHPARSPAFFQGAVQQYIANYFAANLVAGSQLVLITPVYTTFYTTAGEGGAYTYGIQRYRDAMTAAVQAYLAAHPDMTGRVHLVDGLSLMTNAASRLSDGTHPNDLGAAEIAAALTPILQAFL